MSRRRRHSDAAGREQPAAQSPAPDVNAIAAGIPTSRKILFSALLVGSFFALTELGLALGGIHPVLVEEDPYVGFSAYLKLFQPTPSGKDLETVPNKLALFNHQTFQKTKSRGGLRIFSLGGSTTYGHPFDDGTSFSGWLRDYLGALDPERHFEVVNCGGISYGSYRVARVMEELVAYEPDLFIIYSGHNEFLEKRTYSRLIEEPEALTRTKLLLQRTRLWAALQGIAGSARSRARKRYEMTGEVQELLNSSAGLEYYHRDEPFRRQVLSHYRLNLHRMVRLARASGARVILVTTPANEKDFAPFKSEHRAGMSLAEVERHAELLRRASDALDRGDWKTAREAAEAATGLDPLFADGHYLLGRALLKAGLADKASESFTRAIQEDVCPLRALPEINRAILEVGAQEDAEVVDFAALLRARMRDLRGHPILGEEHFMDHVHPTVAANGLLAEALVDRLIASGLVQAGPDWRQRVGDRVRATVLGRVDEQAYARAYKNLSKVLIWAGKRREAEIYVRKAAAVLADDWEVRYNAGVVKLETGDAEGASKSFEEAVRLNPAAAMAWDHLGDVLATRGQVERAVQAGERAVALDPRLAGAWNNLGTSYGLKGEKTRALEAARKAIELEPDFVEAHSNLGNHLFALARPEDALRSYERALELRPRYAEALVNRGLVLGELGRFKSALASFSAALEVDPKLASAHVGRGQALVALGEAAEGCRCFETALEIDAHAAEAYEQLARCLASNGKQAEAEALLGRGMRALPRAARLPYLYGRLLAQGERLAAAADSFGEALRLDPDLAEAWSDLGNVRLIQGRPEDAIRAYDEALRVLGEDVDLRRRLEQARGQARAAR